MSIDPPFNVYREQLSALCHGFPLWNPKPPKKIYNKVSIGDVGYLYRGTFIRMFNVTLPWDNPLNRTLGNPDPYEPLDCGPFTNTLERYFDKVEHYSRSVFPMENTSNMQALSPEEADGVTYKSQKRGAVLSLPNGGYHEDVIRTKPFEDYIRDHIVNWFTWAKKNKLGVERMEELILVTGCTLVTSWAAAVFMDNNIEAQISLASNTPNNGGASLVWREIRGPVVYRNSRFDPNLPTTLDQCVFIRGFQEKRAPFSGHVYGHGTGSVSSPMSIDPPFNIYRDQLAALSQGIALWNPKPPKRIYNKVSIGDVGYIYRGSFIRMFNVMLPWDHPSNRTLGHPDPYESLDDGPVANTLERHFDRVEHYSHLVSAETDASILQASSPDDLVLVTHCKSRKRGAVLSLPNGGYHKDVIRTKPFEDYIQDHIVNWFNWAQNNKLSVERMEDLILVTGCTLVTSWAAAVFVDNIEAEISLESWALSNGATSFVWRNIRGPVVYRNSCLDLHDPSTIPDQCVFIRGFREKRVPFSGWTRLIRAAATPPPASPAVSHEGVVSEDKREHGLLE